MSSTEGKPKIPLLILAGPTAVGKSALAMKVAADLHTEIISADSAQVYRLLDIGTAKPSPEEQNLIKHHLIDLIDPDLEFSVADYQKAAYKIIEKVWREGKIPFIVGGTGLYIKAVTENYAFGQKGADSSLREYFINIAASEGLESLYSRLEKVDPEAAQRIHPRDQRRIIRALEVYNLEGKPISEQVSSTQKEDSIYDLYFYTLHMDRRALYEKIEKRVDMMLTAGLEGEVRALLDKGYDHSSPGMQVLGYRQFLDYLQGHLSYDEAVSEIKKQTRNLAKRQLTWFRREKTATWLEVSEDYPFEALSEIIYRSLKDILP